MVACGLTGHQRTLVAALDGIAPTDGPTRVKDAVALAHRLLADTPNRKVVVLTDGAFPDASTLIGGKDKPKDVEAIVVGKRTGNVAITRFQVRRSLLDPIGYEILAEVANRSDEAVRCRLEIDLGARKARLEGRECDLTGHQFDLLVVLAQSPSRVLSRDQIMDALKGHPMEAFDRSIDVHVSRIRAVIEDDPKNPRRVLTVRGVGYVFARKQDDA